MYHVCLMRLYPAAEVTDVYNMSTLSRTCYSCLLVVVGPFAYACKPGRHYTCSLKHGTNDSTTTGLPKVYHDHREALTGHACPAVSTEMRWSEESSPGSLSCLFRHNSSALVSNRLSNTQYG